MPRDTNKTAVVIAAILGVFLTAMDATVVGTVMPTVVGSLGGIALYSWVFSAYLLTSTVTVPIYGKLADLYGRKPMFVIGTALFLVGSALCGTSRSMEQLIIFRALQGLGAGAVLPITLTIIGDIFTLEQRAKVQGFFSSVWGVAAVVGPVIGALIVQALNWRWVFLINVPIGILSGAVLWVALHEKMERRNHRIDYVGAVTLSGSVVSLLLALMWGGDQNDWLKPQVIFGFALSAALLGLFLWVESRAQEPMLSLKLFSNRIISASSAAGIMLGAALLGTTSFLPLFAQGALGGTPLMAGAVVAPLSLGWPVASFIAGRLMLRLGYRMTAQIGLLLISLGGGLLMTLSPTSPLAWVVAITFVVGLGMGFANTSILIAVQNAVPWQQRGVVTASTQFFRTIGGSIGVALMGTLLANNMLGQLSEIARRFQQLDVSQLGSVNTLLDVSARAAVPADLLTALRAALALSLDHVYMVILVSALLGLAAAFFLPAGSPHEHAVEVQGEA